MDNENTALLAELINAKNSGASAGEVAAMLNSNCGNNWMNNPFIYLIFLALFGNGFGWGGGNKSTEQTSEVLNRLGNLETRMQDSFNNQGVNAALGANHDAINMGFAGTSANINNAIQSGIINAKDMQSTFQSCCCTNQLATQKMGYENQIANLQQTNQLNGRIDQLANGVQQGFSAIGFESARQTADIINANNQNTQRIVDTMNAHWNADLQQRYNDVKLEMSQLNQNATLIAALKTT